MNLNIEFVSVKIGILSELKHLKTKLIWLVFAKGIKNYDFETIQLLCVHYVAKMVF